LENVGGSSVTLPQTVNFDDNPRLLDSNQKVFTNVQLVRLATILKLETSPQVATAAQEMRQEERPRDSRAATCP
jgi:hypothetical protein